MTKSEIAQEIARRTGMQTTDCLHAIDGFIQVLAESFARGNNAYLRGFGTFKVVSVKQKRGYDIHSRKAVQIPAHNIVKFIPSNLLTVKQ